MHKGKITMLGRIMPGSNAVVGHDENGEALFLEYYPPDVRLTETIVKYCEKVVELTGTKYFVIDREVNSEAIASEFEAREWGLLCMLNKNQYKDLSDWNVKHIGELEDGSKVYSGRGKTRERISGYLSLSKKMTSCFLIGERRTWKRLPSRSIGRKFIRDERKFRKTASKE